MPFTPDPEQHKPSPGFVPDPETPKPSPLAPIHVTPDIASDMWKAGVHSKMLGVTPATAYDGREEVDKQLRSQSGNYDDGLLDPTIANDIKVGLEGSIFGLMKNKKLPDQVRNPGMMDRFTSGVTEMLADLPMYLAGGAAGGAAGSEVPVVGNVVGAGMGAFAVPAAMREALVQGIKNGDVKDFPDLLRRTASVVGAATKGAITGAVTEIAGGLPVGKFLAKSPMTASAVKGLYQATALTTAADLLDGKVPTAGDFAGNAALIIPLNLVTHGLVLRHADAKQALMDVYAKSGKTPAESTESLHAQPPVKADMPPGLRPAIQHADGVTEGDAGESHADVAERALAKRPVSMDSLEKDPTRADRVLENPEIHSQDVIDRAYELKKEAVDAGEVPRPLPPGVDAVTRDEAVSAREKANETGRHADNMTGVRALTREMPEGDYVRASVPLEKIDAAGDTDPELVKRYAEQAGEFPPSYGTMEKGKVLLEDGNHRLEAARKRGDKALEVIMPRAEFDAYSGDEKPLTIDDLYDRNTLKSGRGFVTPDGQFLSRMEARKWMKDNEPDVHETWLNEQGGDKQAELHSEAYAEARNRTQARNVAEGDPTIANLAPESTGRIAAAREGLNKIKAGDASAGYGKEVLRTLFAGQRDTRIAATTQLRDTLKKLIPDFHDQEALSILRDYKGTPDKLAADLERIRESGTDREKALIPSIERALEALTGTPSDMVTLYRGEATPGSGKPPADWIAQSDKYKAQQEAAGRWFTPSLDDAKWYQQDASDNGRITSLRVPKAELDKYSARNDPEASKFVHKTKTGGADAKDEYFLPREMAAKAEPFDPSAPRTSPLLKADQMLTDYYANALSEGQQFGFMESSIDPANYSPHILTRILEGEKPSSTGRSVMAQSTPFAKERAYPTILDAIQTGRIDARTVNALDALSIYGDRHATVVATKLLGTELENTELGKYGTRDNHPAGWQELAPRQGTFRSTRTITDAETGEAHTISQSLYVPKDVADAMKPLFESGLAGTNLSPLLKAQGYVKMLELGLSFFHMKALSVTAFNNMGLADFTRSMAADLKSPEFAAAEREWAADGLTTAKTTTPYEAYEGLKKSSIPTGFDKFGNLPVMKQLDAAFKWTTHETFDVIQRKFKVQDASLKGAKWLAKHPEATNEEWFSARRSIAKEVNSAYGGLNWDVLGTGKTVRDVSRLFLLAPDWTFSNVLTAKYSFEGGPAGSAARMFWAKSFATGFAMTAAASIAIGGKYDASDVKHIDQVYLGKDDKGKEMYANWFFAGAPKDAMTLAKRSVSDAPLAGMAGFIVGKAAPAASMLGGLAYNKQGSGAPIYKRTDDTATQTKDQAKFVGTRVVPITGVSAVKTVSDALTDPNHDYSYNDLLSLAADALGSPTVHSGKTETGAATGGSAKRFQSAGRGTAGRKFSIRR